MAYKYIAYGENKRIVRGSMEAASESAVEEALEHQGYQLISLKAVAAGPTLEQMLPSLFQIRAGDVIAFSRQLTTLLEAGIGILAAVGMLQEQASNRQFKRVLDSVIDDLRAGTPFSAALARHPRVFPQLYQRMVEVGERTGEPEAALKQVTDYMERENAASKKLGRAMIYPVMILVMAIAVVMLLITVALPPMVDMFDSLDTDLPLTTRILIGTVNFVSVNKITLLLAGGALGALAIICFRRPEIRLTLDRLLLRVPIIGSISLQGEVARLSRVMSALVRGGLALPETMELAADTARNRAVKQALTEVQEQLLLGQGLSGPMSQIRLFPPVLVQMVKVGEETGTLDSTLVTVADFYEAEAQAKTDAFISLIEPLMTAGIALLVGFIALSVITPMYSIMGEIG
ncbi:MAG: type II secretion system F family protein [Dehalococcoidia bacterium]